MLVVQFRHGGFPSITYSLRILSAFSSSFFRRSFHSLHTRVCEKDGCRTQHAILTQSGLSKSDQLEIEHQPAMSPFSSRAEYDPFRHQVPPSVVARNRMMSLPQSPGGHQHPPAMMRPRIGADALTGTTADGADIIPARRPTGAPEDLRLSRDRNLNREAVVMSRSSPAESQNGIENWSLRDRVTCVDEDADLVAATVEEIEPRKRWGREGAQSGDAKRNVTEYMKDISIGEVLAGAKHSVKSKARKMSSSVSGIWRRRADSHYERLSSGRQTKTPSPIPPAAVSEVEHAIESSESDTPGFRSRSSEQATVGDAIVQNSLDLARMPRARTEPVVGPRRRSMLDRFVRRRTDNADNVRRTERTNGIVKWSWEIQPPRRRARAPSTAAENVAQGASPRTSPRQSLSATSREHIPDPNPPRHDSESGREDFVQDVYESLQRKLKSPCPNPITDVNSEEPATSAQDDLTIAAPEPTATVYACRQGPDEDEVGPMSQHVGLAGLFRPSTHLLVFQPSAPILRTQTPYYDAREMPEEDEEEEDADQWYDRVRNELAIDHDFE